MFEGSHVGYNKVPLQEPENL